MSDAGTEKRGLTLQQAIDNAWAAGVVIIAGAGNQYTSQTMYPAGYANAVAVGSTDQHDIALVLQEVSAGEISGQRLVDRRVCEVELVDFLGER